MRIYAAALNRGSPGPTARLSCGTCRRSRRSSQTCATRSSRGTRSRVAHSPSAGRATHTPCWSRRRWRSRRRPRGRPRRGSGSCAASRRSRCWRPPHSPTCFASGRVSATTGGQGTYGAQRARSSRSMAASCRPTSPRSRPCRASGHTRRAPSPRSPSGCRSERSTPTSDACSGGSSPEMRSTLTPHEMQAVADAAVPPDAPGTWTHALMDLGATVCKASKADCGRCPAQAWCLFASQGRTVERAPRATRETSGPVHLDDPLAARPDPRSPPRSPRCRLGHRRRADRRP